jgi:hypothetical protein
VSAKPGEVRLSSPATLRTNAQAGYTVAAAVAAAVVGAGVFASVDDAPVLVQGAAAITLLLWLAAAWNFMRAVSIQPVLGGIKHEGGPEVLAEEAIAEQSLHAQKTARVAGIATFLTVVLVLVQSNVPGSDRWWQQVWFGAATDYGRVSLSAAGLKHYTTLCGDRPIRCTPRSTRKI